MRVGLLGGTLDSVHLGHLRAATSAGVEYIEKKGLYR
jgi:nicotinic acid mononucleotide adenylyltransferase